MGIKRHPLKNYKSKTNLFRCTLGTCMCWPQKCLKCIEVCLLLFSVNYFVDVILVTQSTQMSLRRLQDVLKRSRRLTTKQDVITTSEKHVGFTTYWRHLIYIVLKTSNLQRLEDVWFTTSSGRLVYDVL